LTSIAVDGSVGGSRCCAVVCLSAVSLVNLMTTPVAA
jgi:hypothetical protein